MAKVFDPKKFLDESKAKRHTPTSTVFENPFPGSIFRTDNLNEMKEACRVLLGDAVQFNDSDFKPCEQSIFNSMDKLPTLPEKIEWRRPN
jgi:hypothetical protein